MYKRIVLLLFSSLWLLFDIYAQSIHHQSKECCPQCEVKNLYRYRDVIYTPEEISISMLTYAKGMPDWLGNMLNLELDVYSGPTCEGLRRPCIIFIHGGGMLCGTKSVGVMRKQAMAFAQRGYLAISVEYRQGWIISSIIDSIYRNHHSQLQKFCKKSPYSCICKIKKYHKDRCSGDPSTIYEAVYRGIQDIRSAIRFLKANADSLGIDPDYIFLNGYSSGGVLALYTAYIEQKNVPVHLSEKLGPLDIGSYLDQKPTVAGIISNFGALLNLNVLDTTDHIPLLMFHGTCDKVVPYQFDNYFKCKKYPVLFGSHAIMQYIENKALKLPYQLVTGCGYNHDFVYQIDDFGNAYTLNFLNLILAHDYKPVEHELFTECKTCYLADCNSRINYAHPVCKQKCGSLCENGSGKNPYTKGNPCNLPYPCE